MKERDPLMVLLISVITLGIYGIIWLIKTKREMVALGADIPTSWLMIVPFVNIWWFWKYSQGIEKVTDNQLSAPLSMVLYWLIGFLALPIFQYYFNKSQPAQQEQEGSFF